MVRHSSHSGSVSVTTLGDTGGDVTSSHSGSVSVTTLGDTGGVS